MKVKGLIAVIVVSLLIVSCGKDGGSQSSLVTVKDSTSYALGSIQTEGIMKEMRAMKVFKYLDTEWVMKGAKDRIDEKTIIDNNKAREVLNSVVMSLRSDSTYTLPTPTKGDVMVNVSDSLGYALGSQIMEGIIQGAARFNVTDKIDNAKVYVAIEDVMNETTLIDAETARKLVDAVVNEARAKEAEEKGAEGEAFLEENKKRDEVKVTESGLQYEVLKKGTGDSPAATDKVKVHYHGTLIDGTVFDSSVERGEPISFALNQVIPGWTEGVQLMKEGAKYKFYIPQELGYGGRAAGKIPPYSTLIFEVELIDIEK